jgi:hypothetical protein
MKIDLQIITSDMKNTMGVYGIRQISTGLFYYIGSSKNVWRRWLEHRNWNLPLNSTSSDEYKAFHKLLHDNLDDFEPVLLDELVDFIHMNDGKRLRRRLVEREKMYIRKYKALGHPIATKEEYQDGKYERTDEIKAKMSAAKKDKLSDETKAKMSAAKTGVPRPDLAGENSPAKRPEVRKKMSANHADFNGENHPCFGTTFTWMHDDKRNYRVPKGQEEQKKKDGLVFGFIKIA